jgi:hypothetical protein
MSFGRVVWILAGLLMAWVIFRWGINTLHGMTQPLPGPPPDGEMRRVTIRYRCSLCGLEIRTVIAAESDPPPPRHCMEDMDLIAPIE